MIVDFISSAKRNHIMTHDDGSKSIFKWGKLRTADKKEIDKIMKSVEFHTKKEIELKTPVELVADYLDGKDPDKFSMKDVENLTDEGLVKLADHYGLKPAEHGNKPTIIKRLLNGRYLDNKANEIVRDYQAELKDEKLLDVLLDAGVITRNKAWYVYDDDNKFIKKEEVVEWCNANAKKLQKQIE